jgi:hypothetical protein
MDKKQLQLYEFGAAHHVGTFNISAAKNKSKARATLLGKPGARFMRIDTPKSGFFKRKPASRTYYKVVYGDKNAVVKFKRMELKKEASMDKAEYVFEKLAERAAHELKRRNPVAGD